MLVGLGALGALFAVAPAITGLVAACLVLGVFFADALLIRLPVSPSRRTARTRRRSPRYGEHVTNYPRCFRDDGP